MVSKLDTDVQALPVTVVIATLGGASLKETIHGLNMGSIVPSEILICVPSSESHKVAGYSFPNVKVIATDSKGQVAQRAIGFKNASCEYVMQLDDDLILDRYCVEILLRSLRTCGPNAAVAASLFWVSTGESFYKPPDNKLLLKWYYWVLNGRFGYQPGKITAAGTNVGVDPSSADGEISAVDWVAGGCVLHRKENLIKENFYPFPGKAYCEDIIHSHYLKERGIHLFIGSKAICWLECPSLWSQSWKAFLRDLAFDFKARQFYVRLTSRSAWRMNAYYVVSVLRFGCTKIFGKSS